MVATDWRGRKASLVKDLCISTSAVDHDSLNIAVRVSWTCGDDCEANILDLGLANSFEEAPRLRRPKVLDTLVRFQRPKDIQIDSGMDFMLVGASLQEVLGPLPHRLLWPRLSENTGHVLLTTACPAIADAAEFFAGALNAWTCAVSQLPVRVTMRVDNKAIACQVMTINDRDRQARCQTEHPPIYEADVADMHVLSRMQSEEAILASPPCQPFSGLGKGQGLDAYSAVAWDRLFRAARICQRRYIVLENVCGLIKHPDFQEIVRTFRFCGYVLVAKRVCDATSIACTARPRVILVFWNGADWRDDRPPTPLVPCVSSLLAPPVSCNDSGSVWDDIPQRLVRDLRLSSEEAELLARRELLPPWLRHSPRPVWQLRHVDRSRPFPSVTAAYHRSMSLPKQHVESKGLHAPLLPVQGGHRRLCKWEILHSFGLPMDLILPEDEESAVALIGESFPPAHAFEAVLLALSLHPQRPMNQAQVTAFFEAGIPNLSPPVDPWLHVDQVDFQGWAKLVTKDSAQVEAANLSCVVQTFWKTAQGERLSFFPVPSFVPVQAPPSERSFFSVEEEDSLVYYKTLCPGWPPRWIALLAEEEVEQHHILCLIANLWGKDPATSVMALAVHADEPCTVLIDEVPSKGGRPETSPA